MRALAILLLLALPAVAQDDAAAKFYRAFWLEQAEGKLAEAEALYEKLLEDHPDAPEGPRAMLGLVRIRVARGGDPAGLIAEFEGRYPRAAELVEARRVASGRTERFDPAERPDDSPIERKLKSLYAQRLERLTEPDRNFLVDLGTVAHPVLAALLRDTDAQAVLKAAEVLVQQGTPEAHVILARGLLDEAVLFQGTIVGEISSSGRASPVLADALATLFDRASPRLRTQIVQTAAKLASREGDGAERAVALLTRALADKDSDVRALAADMLPRVPLARISDACADAFVRLAEANDPAFKRDLYEFLPSLARHEALRDRIENLLVAHPELDWSSTTGALTVGRVVVHHEAAAVVLARVVLRRTGPVNQSLAAVARSAAAVSGEAAAMLLADAIERDEKELASAVYRGVPRGRDADEFLGPAAAALRARTIARLPALPEKESDTIRYALALLGLPASRFDEIRDALRARGDAGLPARFVEAALLKELGPQRAGQLAEFCRDDGELMALLDAGKVFREREDAGIDFFRQVVPRAGPQAAQSLARLLNTRKLAVLVARHLLDATGAEWGWDTWSFHRNPEAFRKHPGPGLWDGADSADAWHADDALRQELLGYVLDPRQLVARTAAKIAAADETAAGTKALEQALASGGAAARGIALQALAERVDDPAALVRAFRAREDLTTYDLLGILTVVGAVEGCEVLMAELLEEGKDDWAELWDYHHQIAPDACVAAAVRWAVSTDNGPEHRRAAVLVLTETADPRRIEVFREILTSSPDERAIATVLRAVHDQYLVELGAETLAHLRNPNDGIRTEATRAIERLKFYAEAKKAFEK